MAFFSNPKKKTLKRQPICSVVIAAAGTSNRMEGKDKLFHELHGAPVIAHTLMAFQKCDLIDEIILVAREDRFETLGETCKKFDIEKVDKIIIGGNTRLESVQNGVFAVSKNAGIIAIHDGARPCVDEKIIKNTIETAAKHHAAAPAVPVSSTIKRVKANRILETVEREDLVEIQTPQIFVAEVIKTALANAFKKGIDITDDCKAVELIGFPVYITEGSRNNIKITSKEDLLIAEAILRKQSEVVCRIATDQ